MTKIAITISMQNTVEYENYDVSGRGGGCQVIFFQTWKFACQCALLGGPGACSHDNFFLNSAFWCISESDFVHKITIFYIKNLKIHVEIHINYSCTHMLGSSGAYASCPERILKMCSWCVLVYILIRSRLCLKKFPKINLFLYEK